MNFSVFIRRKTLGFTDKTTTSNKIRANGNPVIPKKGNTAIAPVTHETQVTKATRQPKISGISHSSGETRNYIFISVFGYY